MIQKDFSKCKNCRACAEFMEKGNYEQAIIACPHHALYYAPDSVPDYLEKDISKEDWTRGNDYY